jgi:SpoVK/Ycf46/Vps4 family AAA+-type ATPase
MAELKPLRLQETVHPARGAEDAFNDLVGIDEQKSTLVDELAMLLDRKRLDAWRRKHHAAGLPFLDRATPPTPLVLLSGDVGCGKTALASCVATMVAKRIDDQVLHAETPSDVRGSGLVGELSTRLTEAFTQARTAAARIGRGILVIDEADDIATRRGQSQAHHEDRAGVNVLIKQLDLFARDKTPMAVIMITNRADVLDPAVLRRAALRLDFGRPDEAARTELFRRILGPANGTDAQIRELVKLSGKAPGYTYSDITVRVARSTLRRCFQEDKPFGAEALKQTLATVLPSPIMDPA